LLFILPQIEPAQIEPEKKQMKRLDHAPEGSTNQDPADIMIKHPMESKQ